VPLKILTPTFTPLFQLLLYSVDVDLLERFAGVFILSLTSCFGTILKVNTVMMILAMDHWKGSW
jgi:hypothetical protein